MDERETRLARNEAVFREVNERVRHAAESHGTDPHVYLFFCECSNIDCTLQLPLTSAEYEAVRADGRQFVVATGHELPEIDRIVQRRPDWTVVAKDDQVGEFVAERDPRT